MIKFYKMKERKKILLTEAPREVLLCMLRGWKHRLGPRLVCPRSARLAGCPNLFNTRTFSSKTTHLYCLRKVATNFNGAPFDDCSHRTDTFFLHIAVAVNHTSRTHLSAILLMVCNYFKSSVVRYVTH